MSLPRPLQLALALAGILTLLSVAVGLVLSLRQSPPAWFFIGFEVVIAVGAAFLVVFGLGRIKEGPAITLLCCAGAIGVGSLLGWVGTGKQINGQGIMWLVSPRIALAGLLVALAALELILRAPREVLPRLLWAVAAAAPLGLLAFLLKVGVIQSMMGRINASSPPLAFGAWMIFGLVVCVLVSMAGHYFITAFDAGVKAWGQKPLTRVQTLTQPSSATNAPPPGSTPSGTPS